MMVPKVAIGLVLAAGMFAATAGVQSSQAAEVKPYSLAVFPYFPPRELEKIYAPVAADLSNQIGRTIHFRTSSTYAKYLESVEKKRFELVFVQPFDYVRLADKLGYEPLATRKIPLSAIIVVKPESSADKMEDFRGKVIAMPPETAAVSYLMKNELRAAGLTPGKDVTVSHFRSHVSCMQQVLLGQADACATAKPAVRFFQAKMGVKLKPIIESQKIPNSLFAVHKRVPQEIKDKLLERILSWEHTTKGKALLKNGKLKPFKKIKDSDYDVVRGMR